MNLSPRATGGRLRGGGDGGEGTGRAGLEAGEKVHKSRKCLGRPRRGGGTGRGSHIPGSRAPGPLKPQLQEPLASLPEPELTPRAASSREEEEDGEIPQPARHARD